MRKTLLALLLAVCGTLSAQITITMEEDAGVYKVPCVVNGAKMKFIFDTGASTVCLSESMAEYLLDNDYISKEDFVGTGTSTMADGREVSHLRIILRDIEIGGLHLKDVEASVIEGQRAPLLLGQTAIQKIGKVSIEGNKLTIDNGIGDDVDIAIGILRERAINRGLLSKEISFDRWKKILTDRIELQDYFNFVQKREPTYYNMTWESFVIEISKLLHAESNNLVTKKDIDMHKCLALVSKAKKYEEQNQYLLAAETWEEYFNIYWEINQSDFYTSLNGYTYSKQGEDAYFVGKNFYDAKEYNKAMSWLIKSANKGYRDAQFRLGYMYSENIGVKRDYYTAVGWYRKAAENNHATAQMNLGFCYVNGYGVQQSTTEGFKWTCKAFENGEKTAERNLVIYFNEFYEAAENGNNSAAFYLGLCYANGYGTNRNYYESLKWYKVSANSGDPAGMNNLANLYYYGLGTPEDKGNAVFWWKKAAEQGDTFAQISLAQCYENGVGIEQDYLKAFNWYMQAADKDDVTAICELGKMLLYGYGVQADYAKAKSYFEKAAQKEYEEAYYILGNIYWQGFGVKQNQRIAVDWWYKCSSDFRDKRGINYLIAIVWRDGKGREKDIEMHLVWMNYCEAATDGLNELAYDFALGRSGWNKQLPQAFAVINKAIEINPQVPNYYDSKGEFYSMQNNLEKAKEMWLKVKALDATYYTRNNTNLNKYIQIQQDK